MKSRLYLLYFTGFLVCSTLLGCEKLPWGQSTSSTDDEFGDFADFDSEKETDREETAATDAPAYGQNDGNSAGMLSLPSAADLSLQLPVGARFPLVKTIEQRLTQQLSTGPVVGQSKLELQLSLLVEEQQAARRRIGVRYHRVRYWQDLGGEVVNYDSAAPPAITPPAALSYAGLKDNTFSFWLGPDNRVQELVGFNEFLRRCVANVPLDQRQNVLNQLSSLGSEDGLANFVDDSIGLLPNPADPQLAGQPLKIGSRWAVPSKMASATQCLLQELTPTNAQIAIVGQISPSNYVDDLRHIKLSVQGGQCSGLCIVDRKTGMPTQCRIDRQVDMVAQLADGTQIPQRKEIVTTVTAFLDQGTTAPLSNAGYAPATMGAMNPVQPAGYRPQ
ncbi:hypothetical protein GC163_14420 [bacterium]|nr:hypothetical protein [bacterium]